MTAKRRTSGGLAARIVRVTITVGVLTVIGAVTVGLISTSRLSAEKAEGRDLLAVQLVEDAVEERLRTVEIVLNQVSLESATATDTAGARRRIDATLGEASDLLVDAYVAEDNGLVLASMPGGSRLSSVRNLAAFGEAGRGVSGFFGHSPSAGARRELWFARAVVTGDGRPVIVLAHVNTDFLEPIIERVAKTVPERTVAVVDRDNFIYSGGAQHPYRPSNARWRPTSPSSGALTVNSEDGVPLSGVFNDILGITGVSWRIVIVEPAEVALRDTVRAVAPSVAILVVGGFIGVGAAWGLSQRLVRPLRELERTARSAAAGSYVQPFSTDTDDEIGAVAEAFNALALRLNALQDLAQLLASASQLGQVLDGILSAMGHIVGPGAAAIYLLDADGTSLRPARTRGIDLASAQDVDVSVGGWLADALYSASPTEFHGTPDELEIEIPGLEGVHRSALAAPLVVGADALGVVVVLTDAGNPVTDAEREMVRTFSAQAAVAVQTSRLFEEESESRKVAEALRAVAEELVRPEALDRALAKVEWIIQDVLRAPFASVVILDRAAVGLAPETARPRDKEVAGVALRVLSREGGVPVSVPLGSDHGVDEVLREFDAAELVVVPVALDTDHGAVLVVALAQPDEVHRGVSIARALADEIALALDNAYFFGRAVTRAANLETIFRISQAVGSSLQVNVVLNRVLDVVQKILSADAVALLSYDTRKRALHTAMARGMVPPSVLHLEVQPGEDLPGHVFSSGEPVAVRDLHAGMDGVAGSAAVNDLGSLLAVPLLARGRPIGVLMVFSASAGAFSDEDLSVLQTFASQAALALDTARLYSREHEVATVLQQSILPEALPVFPEVVSASVYAPAGGEAEIGGDYYDLFRSSDGSLWFAIADVCGKGVQAATKTSMIKYALRAFVAAGLGPARVVSEVNRMATEAGDPSDIVTVWVGRYDPVEATLTWANGGHPPGLLKRANGEFVALSTTGPLLGAMADAHFDEESVAIRSGDAVLLFTDGVTEARQGNTFFGDERVRESFARSELTTDAARDLLDAVRAFVSGDLRDDVAVLAIGVNDVENMTAQSKEGD